MGRIYLVFGLAPCVLRPWSIVLWLRDYTDDIIQTMMIMIGLILSFSILFLSWGLLSQKVVKPWLLWRLWLPIVNAKSHILAPYRTCWTYLGFVLGRFTNTVSWNLGRCDQRYGSWKDRASLWWECVLLDLDRFLLWFMKASFIYQQKIKTNH